MCEVVYLPTFYATLSENNKVAYYLKTKNGFAFFSGTIKILLC